MCIVDYHMLSQGACLQFAKEISFSTSAAVLSQPAHLQPAEAQHTFLWRRLDHLLLYCAQPACPVQVTEAQRAFIRRMLGFSNFNKHLAAVRETHAMLWATQHVSKQETGPMQALPMSSHIRWMQEHSVVQQLLRSNLHQKQYVEQVGVRAALEHTQPRGNVESLPQCPMLHLYNTP